MLPEAESINKDGSQDGLMEAANIPLQFTAYGFGEIKNFTMNDIDNIQAGHLLAVPTPGRQRL